MKKLILIFALSFCFCSEFDSIFIKYGKAYNIPPILLLAIAKHESGLNKNAVNKNKNGSIDYGLMQINSCHLPKLKSMGYDKNNLFNPEINIKFGSIILKRCINLVGFNYKALNCYNGKIKNNRYNIAVLDEIRKIKKDKKWQIIKK